MLDNLWARLTCVRTMLETDAENRRNKAQELLELPGDRGASRSYLLGYSDGLERAIGEINWVMEDEVLNSPYRPPFSDTAKWAALAFILDKQGPWEIDLEAIRSYAMRNIREDYNTRRDVFKFSVEGKVNSPCSSSKSST